MLKLGLTFLVAAFPVAIGVGIVSDGDNGAIIAGILLGAAMCLLAIGAISRIWNA